MTGPRPLDQWRQRNAAFWAAAADGWVHQAERHDRLGTPLGSAAMRALAARGGERLLDVGCGCGATTAELARAAGPEGAVTGLDLSPAMVAAARRRFPTAAYPTLQWLVGDVETMAEVPGAPFDAIYSRMTLMLLADPVAGLSTLRRSLRPGGRLAASTFRDGASCGWLAAVMLGAAAHVGPLPPLPIGDEPGPFAFADPAAVRAMLAAAGFVDVAVDAVDVEVATADDPDTVAEWLIELGPAGAAYRAAGAPAQAAARAGAAGLLRRYHQPGGGYRLPTGTWLLTARCPA